MPKLKGTGRRKQRRATKDVQKDVHSLHFLYTFFASFHVFGDIFPDCYTFIPTTVYKLNNWLVPFCLFQSCVVPLRSVVQKFSWL